MRARIRRALRAAAAVTVLAGAALAWAHPAGAAAPITWSGGPTVDPATPASLACPSDSLCVAVDAAGNALTSTDPEAPAPAWSAPAKIASAPLTGVSCAGASLCVAVDSHGVVHTTGMPTAGAWIATPADEGHALTAVSCPDSTLCVAVDDAGQALAGSPGGGWSAPAHVAPAALRSVSCAAATLCAAVDAAGDVLTSTDRGVTWQLRPLSRGVAVQSVSCPLAALCGALDAEGDALASADPWPAPPASPTWAATQTGLAGASAIVSCTAARLCVFSNGSERVVASDNPATPVPQWSESRATGLHPSALTCLASGACVGLDAAGKAFSGRVSPPEPATGTPAEVTSAAAALAGTLNPNDALLTGCWFEYGTSAAYGSSAPCATIPTGSAPVAVTTQLAGLAANTVYHYRLVAASAIAQRAGSDATFTTPTAAGAPLLYPHPSIRGTPAVGQRLTCSPGVSGASRIVYRWLRDLVAIPFSASSTYLVKGTDSGHHLQCEVTASDEGGDATARSTFVTIPAGGAPFAAGETSIGAPRLRGHTLLVPVSCSPRAGRGCNVSLRLTAVETLSGRRVVAVTASTRRTVTLASARAFIARGSGRTVALVLTPLARRLLAARHRIPARLKVTGTVIGVIESTLLQRVISLGSGARGATRSSHGTRR